jgi:uncharacterized membrane protein YcaP (DUF421 family)
MTSFTIRQGEQMGAVLRAVFGYSFLVFMVRIAGRRPGKQMFEFVLVFLIGGVIILTTVGDDRSEVNSVCAVMMVGLIHRVLSGLAERYDTFGRIVYGIPLLLLKDGQWQSEVMRRTRIQETDVMAAARNKGVKTLDGIKYAILERQGGISIIQK